jgi:hypothetical protein
MVKPTISYIYFYQFLPRNGFFLAVFKQGSSAVDRYSLRFEFQLPHSNPILVNNRLQIDSSSNFLCFSKTNMNTFLIIGQSCAW